MNTSQIQSRHILGQLGVRLWASRACASQSVPAIRCRLNPRLEHLLVKRVERTQEDAPAPAPTPSSNLALMPDAVPTISQPTSNDTKDNISVLSDVPDTTPKALTPTILPTPAHPPKSESAPPIASMATSLRFHLQGVRFGKWVLTVDLVRLDDELVFVWQSLKSALENHAKQHHISHHTHEVHYPMISVDNDYKEHHHLLPAEGVCWGFLFGLGADDDSRLLCLSAMPDAFAHQCSHNAPTLAQMLSEPTLKKTLWQMLTCG